MTEPLRSCLCRQSQLESPVFRAWIERMGESFFLHRKLWEYAFVSQALFERGMLRPGRRGLGFAVGQEPLTALFASFGSEILATDLDPEAAGRAAGSWTSTGQHASSLDSLNSRGICDPALFARNVTFRPVDMREIPPDLGQFDFVWSSCAVEHLGSIDAGKRCIHETMRCVRPGGVAVHTAEFNVGSDDATLDHSWVVLFRRRDIEEVARRLRTGGHRMDPDFGLGAGEADLHVDLPPYRQNPHIKLEIEGFVATSIGLVIESRGPSIWRRVLGIR